MGINLKKIIIAAVIFAALALMPSVVKTEYLINVLVVAFIYVIIGQSWNILGGYAGQINVGQAAFFGIGALIARLLLMADYSVFLALLAGGIASVVLAAVIGLPALRLRGHYFAIGTLALSIIAKITVGNLFPGVSFASVEYTTSYSLVSRYYVGLFIVLLVTAVTYYVFNSKIGLGIMATRENEDASEAVGINIFKYKVSAFALSSFFAGLGGGLFAYYFIGYYFYDPFGLLWSFEPILIAFIGGAGSILGPILGAILYVALKEVFALTMGEISVMVFGVVFILVVLFLPKGLVSLPQKIRGLFKKTTVLKNE